MDYFNLACGIVFCTYVVHNKYNKANESFNINYRTGKVNLFGNYSYNYNKGSQSLDLTRNFRDSATGDLESIFKQHTDMTPRYQTHNFKIGMDYYAAKKTTLGVVLNGYVALIWLIFSITSFLVRSEVQ